MGFRNTSSLVVITAALLLVIFYVRPTLTTIGELQDQIFVYKDNADKVTEVNNRLQELRGEIRSLRQSDVVALETYLPTQTDVLQVMYDVENVANTTGMTVTEINSAEDGDRARAQPVDYENLGLSEEEIRVFETMQTVHSDEVQVSVVGTYENFKRFLAAIAVNNYPLEVVSLEFGRGAENDTDSGNAGSIQSYSLTLRTYAFNYLRNR